MQMNLTLKTKQMITTITKIIIFRPGNSKMIEKLSKDIELSKLEKFRKEIKAKDSRNMSVYFHHQYK